MKRTLEYYLLFFFSFYLFSCNTNSTSLPKPPKDSAQVKGGVTNATFKTEKIGHYGNLTINEVTEVDWLSENNEDKMTAKAVKEWGQLKIKFLNDTAAQLSLSDTLFEATYIIEERVDEYDDVKEGVKLRLTYLDPIMGPEFSKITYTYLVKGYNDGELLLQLPYHINRRPLVALLKKE